jgi:excisionase family DNA binding protein
MKSIREQVIEIEPIGVRYITAAKMLEVSESTVRKLEREGKLTAVLIGADRRIAVASIKKLVAAA